MVENCGASIVGGPKNSRDINNYLYYSEATITNVAQQIFSDLTTTGAKLISYGFVAV